MDRAPELDTVALARRGRGHRPAAIVAVAAALVLVALIVVAVDRPGSRAPAVSVAPGGRVVADPEGLAVAPDGSLLIASGDGNQVLRRLPNATIQVVAGRGRAGDSGDGGLAARAELNHPSGLAVAADGTIYVADSGNNRVRAISPRGVIRTVAGLAGPVGLAIGPDGSLYVAAGNGIDRLSPAGRLTLLIAGGPASLTVAVARASAPDTCDPVPCAFLPSAIAVDRAGDLYVADESPRLLVEFSATGRPVVAWEGYIGTVGLAAAPDGTVVAGSYGLWAIERIEAGQWSQVAGFLNSESALSGFRPQGVAVAGTGEIFASNGDGGGGRPFPEVVAVNPNGTVHMIVGR